MVRNIYINEHYDFLNGLLSKGHDFFVGVPDSTLKNIIHLIGAASVTHVVATHESQAMGIAVGAHLAGKKTCVYLQNSGLGNLVNPITSLCFPFKIFPFLIIGHRHSLPQHKVMGEIDDQLLEIMGYENYALVHGDNNVK